MLFEEFEQRRGQPGAISPDSSLSIEAGGDGACVVDGLTALPLESVSLLLPRGQMIEVTDESNAHLADVLLCEGDPFDIPRFSAHYLAAYLAEAVPDDYGQSGRFSRNHLLIRADRLEEYKARYMAGSPIWGGLQHPLEGAPLGSSHSDQPLKAVPRIALPTEVHVEIARRSVQQIHAFERYLRLYHLLELSFDFDVVQKIRALGDDLKGVGQIFSSLESKELDRLKSIVRRSRVPANVINCVRQLTSNTLWHGQMQAIFFEFGKDGNPLVGREAEFFEALLGGGFTAESVRSLASIPKGTWDATRQVKFEQFTLSLVSYWIYRTRSSIVHSRLGEYVMRSTDEPFVAFFSEPLLRCILMEVL